jgi:hypothetical protein
LILPAGTAEITFDFNIGAGVTNFEAPIALRPILEPFGASSDIVEVSAYREYNMCE